VELYRAGKLIPKKEAKDKMPTFAKFAEGWWDYETCPYLQKRKARRPIAQSSADRSADITKNHLLPEFGDMRLDEITSERIETWLSGFKPRGYSNATANNAVKALRVMLE
jgi:hypothetical protein